MNVSKKLIEALKINPTKSTQMKSVQDLTQMALNKEILLPQYQTGIRWTIQKCVDLLNYQLKGKAPVSAISMHIIDENNEVIQVSYLDRDIIEEDLERKLSTTDGQQRITCNLKAYIDDASFKPIVLDLLRGEFVINNDTIIKKYQIPVGVLMNKDLTIFNEYMKKNKTLNENYQTIAFARTKLLSYSYVINIGQGMNKSEQLEWFEKLNNAGSKIPKIQVRLTALTKSGIDINAEYINKFIEIINLNGYEEIFPMKNTEFSIPIALLNPYIERKKGRGHLENWSPLPSDVKVRDLCNLKELEIRQGFNDVIDSLKLTLTFFYDNDIEVIRVDYITYITGYLVYHNLSEIDETLRNLFINWINNIEFTNKSNAKRREYFSNLLKIKL